MVDVSKSKKLDELEFLEGKIGTLQELVQESKRKTLVGDDISDSELKLIEERINNMQDVINKRRDVGH